MSLHYETVTGWSARRRHYVEPGGEWMACKQGSVVRPGDRYAHHSRRPMTRELIDAMPLCKVCERIAAKGVQG